MTCSLAVTSLLQIVVIWINLWRERINKNNYFREKNLKSSNSELVWRLPWLSGINLMCTALCFNICIYYSDRHLKPSYSPSSASFRLDPPSVYNLTSWSNDGCSSSSYHVHIPSMQRSKMPSPSRVIFHKIVFSCALDNI